MSEKVLKFFYKISPPATAGFAGGWY